MERSRGSFRPRSYPGELESEGPSAEHSRSSETAENGLLRKAPLVAGAAALRFWRSSGDHEDAPSG